MPRIPYSPVPEVGTSMQAIPSVSEPTPSAAFGGAVAEGTREIGSKLEGAGNELFARAMAMQDLKNRADADEAVTNFDTVTAARHAKFNSLQGMDRVNDHEAFLKDIEDARQQAGSSLNPIAKRYYESESRGMQGRLIFSSGAAAGEALKDWQIKNGEKSLDLLSKSSADNWQDDNLNNQNLEAAKQKAIELGQLHGFSPDDPWTQDKIRVAQSQITRERLVRASRDAPMKAPEMFEQLKDKLYGHDVDYTDNAVHGSHDAVMTQNLADTKMREMFNDDGSQRKSLNQAMGEIAIAGQKLKPDDPGFIDSTQKRLQGLLRLKNNTDKMDSYTAHNQLMNIIIDKGFRNEQQLRTDPQAAILIDTIKGTDPKFKIDATLQRFIDSTFKDANQEEFTKLKSMADTDRDTFYQTDFTTKPISAPQIAELEHLRSKLLNAHGQEGDPIFMKAMRSIEHAKGSELNAMGVYPRSADNFDDRMLYQGTLYSAVQEWRETHNRPPTEKELLNEIYPAVVQKHVEKTFFHPFSGVQVPQFKAEVPEEAKARWRARYPYETGAEADAKMRADYNNALFQQLFSKPKSTGE